MSSHKQISWTEISISLFVLLLLYWYALYLESPTRFWTFVEELPYLLLLVGVIIICIIAGIGGVILLYLGIEKVQEWFARKSVEKEERKKQAEHEELINKIKCELDTLVKSKEYLLYEGDTMQTENRILEAFKEFDKEEFVIHEEIRDYIQKILQPFAEKIEQIDKIHEEKNERLMKKKKEAVNSLEPERRYYKKDKLSEIQQEVLIQKGYVCVPCREFTSMGNPLYLLKPRANESPQHFFLVKHIEEYLRDKVKRIELKNSVEIDIEFEFDNQVWGIEIETGSMMESKPNELIEKVKRNNFKYGENWYFVVTSDRIKKKYRKLNPKTYNRSEFLVVLKKLIKSVGKSP